MGRTIDLLPVTLNALMRFRDMNQTELAERSEISKSQINRYLNGRTVPQLRQLDKLLDALSIDLATFGQTLELLGRMQHDLNAEQPDRRHLLPTAAFHSRQDNLLPSPVKRELTEILRHVVEIASLIQPSRPIPRPDDEQAGD